MKRHGRRRERGISLMAIGIWIVALAVMAAAAVDIARLAHTASEIQSIADASALSGTRALFKTGGDSSQAIDAARTTGNFNMFDGKFFPLTDDSTGSMAVDTGHFDGTTYTAGGAPPNAVRARPTGKNVHFVAGNLISAFVGGSGATGSDVTKEAIAAFGCGATCRPELPLAACIGTPPNQVNTALSPDVPCGTVGVAPLSQAPAAGSSCWTCLSPSCSTGSSSLENFLPPECGTPGAAPTTLGEQIEVDNGQHDSALKALKDCIKPTASGGKNWHFFRVPVIDSCSCTGTAKIVNFVTLKIGCTDPNCTSRESCACTGSDASGLPYNTWSCSSGSPCHVADPNNDPTKPAVQDGGSDKGIWYPQQVCDEQPCNGIVLTPGSCGGDFGLALVK
jgi:hypothetical protein